VPLIDLSGKIALITGGSRGIGAATARLFAEAGATVAFTYRSRKADADRVLGALPTAVAPSRRSAGAGAERQGGRDEGGHRVYQADLSSREANERVVSDVVRDLGGLDFFVANAGIWPPEEVPVVRMSDAQWRESMQVNLDAVFYGCRAVLRVIRPGGSIVIVTSTAGQRGEGFHADYAATKGALIAFVKSLAVEAAPAITVNSVAPGWVDTEMAALPYEADGGEGRTRIEAGIPLRRVATAEDIAGPIVFLCSTLGRHITGEILNVNGGAVLCG
jgi:3-oxoacyl-[acyl-carrier protein] reductase